MMLMLSALLSLMVLLEVVLQELDRLRELKAIFTGVFDRLTQAPKDTSVCTRLSSNAMRVMYIEAPSLFD